MLHCSTCDRLLPCADEHYYIREWVMYHGNINKIYVYDDGSWPPMQDELAGQWHYVVAQSNRGSLCTPYELMSRGQTLVQPLMQYQCASYAQWML
jgi:hypothetical protein